MYSSNARRRLRSVLAAAIAIAAMSAAPGLASAQSLHSVAISTRVSSGYFVLDVSGASTDPGAPVIQWIGNGGSNQHWNVYQLPDGNKQIVNQNSGMCLTTDGVAGHWVYQWWCDSSNPHQEWSGSLPEFWSGTSTLKNPYSGLYLDVSGDAGWAGAHIITWYGNGTNGEYFSYYQL